MNQPFFTVVIANFNGGKYLAEAIESILAQDMNDEVELIICDAASTDNSVEIIEKYANGLPPNTLRSEWRDPNAKLQTSNSELITWWCSEKDGGQSEAFNKGFVHGSGLYLTWLNADDFYLPGALASVKRTLEHCPQADWATGNLIRFNQHTKKIIEAAWGPHWVPFCLQGNGFPVAVFGPTAFWKRMAYEKVGPLDNSLHYTMDSDYWRRLTVAGCKFVRVNHDCWAFRMHEESKTAEFGEHQRTSTRKAIMHEETLRSEQATGCRDSSLGRIVRYVFRILDGSLCRSIWRRFFLVGRSIDCLYKPQMKENIK